MKGPNPRPRPDGARSAANGADQEPDGAVAAEHRAMLGGPARVSADLLAAAMAVGMPLRRDRDLAQLLATLDPSAFAGPLEAERRAATAAVLRFLGRLDAAVQARLDAADDAT